MDHHRILRITLQVFFPPQEDRNPKEWKKRCSPVFWSGFGNLTNSFPGVHSPSTQGVSKLYKMSGRNKIGWVQNLHYQRNINKFPHMHIGYMCVYEAHMWFRVSPQEHLVHLSSALFTCGSPSESIWMLFQRKKQSASEWRQMCHSHSYGDGIHYSSIHSITTEGENVWRLTTVLYMMMILCEIRCRVHWGRHTSQFLFTVWAKSLFIILLSTLKVMLLKKMGESEWNHLLNV